MASSLKTSSIEHDSAFPRYVEEMAEQMQKLVPGPRYNALRYLLDMARLEAKTQAAEMDKRTHPPVRSAEVS